MESMLGQSKRIVAMLLWLLWLPSHAVFSQPHTSKDNYTGAWESPTSWSPIWAVPQTIVSGNDITINGYITVNGSLSFKGTANKLVVNDTLVIKGDLLLDNNNDIVINDYGIIIVMGNLTINNQTTVTVNGYLIVAGNFTKNSSQGSFTSNDNPVKVFICGTIMPLGLTNINPDYPALNCTTPITSTYPNSHCSYGNLTDLGNDPIDDFFRITCSVTNVKTNNSICVGNQICLMSSKGVAYSWSGPNGFTSSVQSPSIPNASSGMAGDYIITVTTGPGCTDKDTINLIVNALPAVPSVTASESLTFCAGDSVILTSSAGTSYLWSTGATTPIINVDEAGSYTVRVTDANGCQSAASIATIVAVNALPATPTITASGSTTFCEGASVILTSSAGISSLWSTGVTAPSINVTETGSYTVRVTDANGCQSEVPFAIVVTVNALPAMPTITASGPLTFCSGGSVTLTSSLCASYLWSTGATSPSINVTAAGSYTVMVTSASGCQSATSVATDVNVNEVPFVIAGPDQKLEFVFETQMHAELVASETGEWSLISGSGNIQDIHSPTARVTGLQGGENLFLWKVWNSNCEASAEVKITVYDPFVPSVITPGGDGKNDYFKISEIHGRVGLIIFNQWGFEEYRNGNYSNDWDGRNSRGEQLPNGTYFYVLIFENGKIIKGSVLIKR